MNFKQHYSSSSANLYTVSAANGKKLLVECGCKWPKIQKALNFDLSDIVGCLVSHEHADHSHAIKEVMKAGIDVYASEGTLSKLNLLGNRRAKILTPNTLAQKVGIFEVYSFLTHHDGGEPLGFMVRERMGAYKVGTIGTEEAAAILMEKTSWDGFTHPNYEHLFFATDTSHITQRVKIPFNIIALECSYDKDILQNRVDTNDINESLAKRLLTSHMEKQNTINYLDKFCNLSKCREIHLLHLSGDNIDKEQTRKEIEERFFRKTVIVQGKEAVSNVEVSR